MAAANDGLDRDSESIQIDQLLDSLRPTPKLSRRERQVAIGCARGLDTKSTAAALGLSPKTVDELWRRVYKKFNCHSRVEILSRLLASALGRAGRKRPIGVPDPSGRNVAFQPLGSRLRAENKKRTSRA